MQKVSLDLPGELKQLHAHSLKVLLPADSTCDVTVSTFPIAPRTVEPPPSPATLVEDDSRLYTTQVNSLRALDNVLEQYSIPKCQLRLYSIHQRHSCSALNINQLMLVRLMDEYNITPKFLRHLSAFYQRMKSWKNTMLSLFTRRSTARWLVSTAILHNITVPSRTSQEYMFALRYAEYKPDSGDLEPWTVSQSCIYHQYNSKTKQSVVILVSPKKSSSAESRILDGLQALIESGPLDKIHFAPCIELITSYLDFWRPYLRHYEERVERLSRDLMGSQPNLEATPADIHFFESRFLPVEPALSSLMNSLDGIKTVYSELASSKLATAEFQLFLELDSRLDEFARQLPAYQSNTAALLQKCSSLTQLLEKTVAMKQGQHLLKLTKETKIITVVALSYLSFSVVAAVISMPLFYLDDTKDKLLVSPAFWIYIAVSVPLTLATFTWWKMQMWRNRAANDASDVAAPRRWWRAGRKKLSWNCSC